MAMFLSSVVYADGSSEGQHGKSIENVLQEIRGKYGISSYDGWYDGRRSYVEKQ
jgi:hypothetical protein